MERHFRVAWRTLVVLIGSASIHAAQPSTATSVRSVQIVVQEGATVAIIEADGPLPLPTSGTVDDPPRIYLDLAGVTPQARGTTQWPGGGAVRGVRIALHATGPNVTRVVLDLARSETFRIRTDELQSGRLVILIGSESRPTAPPVAVPPAPATPSTTGEPIPAPAIAAPTVSVPVTEPSPVIAEKVPAPAPPTPARRNLPRETMTPDVRLPPSEVEQYRRQLQGALERIESRRSVVEAIDTAAAVPIDALEFTAVEFSDLRRILGAIKPSEALQSTHDMLAASCTLAASATSLAIQATRNKDAEARRNAPSAAAGALMLLDRACARLGCAGTRH